MKKEIDYRSRFIAKCRDMGIGDLSIGHRFVATRPLTKEDWRSIYFAYLSFQHQIKLIVAHREATP